MNDTKFVAGWNLPGCIPEMEPVEFDSQADAEEFIREEQAAVQEAFGSEYDDPYVYWVEVA